MRGKWTIAIMLGLAIVAGSVAWWHAWSQGHRALALWGGSTAYLIRTAPRVELYRVRLDSPPAPPAPVPAEVILGHREISRARGLTHARQALIEDASYAWKGPVAGSARWQYALLFRAPDASAVLYFDLDRALVARAPGGQRASIRPIAQGLQLFFDEQFADRPATASRPEARTTGEGP